MLPTVPCHAVPTCMSSAEMNSGMPGPRTSTRTRRTSAAESAWGSVTRISALPSFDAGSCFAQPAETDTTSSAASHVAALLHQFQDVTGFSPWILQPLYRIA